MPQFLVILAMAVLAAVLACGTSMDIDDYAEECGEWQDDYYGISSDALDDWKTPSPTVGVRDWHNLHEDALDDWKALRPPGEVKEWHNLRTEAIEVSLEILKLQEEFEDKMDDLRDDLEDLSDDIEDAWDDLSRRDRRDLEREGCDN